MEKLCIDVRGFSDEKKKRVQDAFFALGIKWFWGRSYEHLYADWYSNVFKGGGVSAYLLWGDSDMLEHQKKYAITYRELMRKAGMGESDPDAIISPPTKEDLEREINRLSATEKVAIRLSRAFSNKPEQILNVGKQEDLQSEKQAEEVAPRQTGELTVGIELVTDLQSIISDYLHLLDAIKDPYARGVIKSQITDLTDLQYQQLTGGNNE